MIVVALTSWKERINNCAFIINNILSGTIVPEVYLTLSSDEFKKKEEELPEDLLNIINNNKNIHLNWVKENTKCMKKVFPILQFLNEDDIILCIDDDIIYPKDYIESRVNEYKSHLQPISGVSIKEKYLMYKKWGFIGNLGGGSLFTKKMLNHWREYLSDEIIKSNNDDTCYAVLQWLNGYVPQECIKYDTSMLANKYKYNETSPSGKLKRYLSKNELLSLHEKRIMDISGNNVKESFNFFNKNNMHHIFIPYIADFSDDPTEDNNELKYAVRGINNFFTEKHIIHIISDKEFIINEPNVDLIILPKLDCADNKKATRFADSMNRIKYAFEVVGCDEAIIHWDDTYALNPYTYEDCKHSKWVDKNVYEYKRGNVWGDGVCNALDCIAALGGTYNKNYCSHLPFVWKKDNLLKMTAKFDYIKNPFNGDLAYFNIYKQQDEIFVPWKWAKTNPKKCIYKKEVRTESDLRDGILNSKWATIDIPLINFNHFKVLDEIYKKVPNDITSTPSEIDTIKSKIEQIKSRNDGIRPSRRSMILDDISAGRIVKIPHKNGYVWKRIK